VSFRSWDGIAEPDSDRGDVDGSAPDEVAFVEPGSNGAVLAELAEGPLDRVALLVCGGVERGRAAAGAAAPFAVTDLVSRLANGGFDLAPAPRVGEQVNLAAQPAPRPP
jgi:hypothetical protein